MCAPGDQRKSSGGQREQAKLNELRFQRCVDASRGERTRSASRRMARSIAEDLNSRNERLSNVARVNFVGCSRNRRKRNKLATGDKGSTFEKSRNAS